MATQADLQTALDKIKATETGEASALTAMGTALTSIVAKLNSLPPAGVMTQEQLDAAFQEVTDIATQATTNAAALTAESTQAVAADVPPTP